VVVKLNALHRNLDPILAAIVSVGLNQRVFH
jgi:hypothetical protein